MKVEPLHQYPLLRIAVLHLIMGQGFAAPGRSMDLTVMTESPRLKTASEDPVAVLQETRLVTQDTPAFHGPSCGPSRGKLCSQRRVCMGCSVSLRG